MRVSLYRTRAIILKSFVIMNESIFCHRQMRILQKFQNYYNLCNLIWNRLSL